MARVAAVWYGEQAILDRLTEAVAHNCTCPEPTTDTPQPPTCPAHQLLLDQMTLNRFAFVARFGESWQRSEFRRG